MPEKYQEEIEEILKGLGQQAPDKPVGELERPVPVDDAPRGMNPTESAVQPNPYPTRRWPKITPSKVALLGLASLVIGAFWLWPLIWVGLVLLAVAYLMFFVRPRFIHHEKCWRDRPIEDKPTSPWAKLARWLKD